MRTYFISNGTHYKIGRSSNVQDRLATLQTSSAVRLKLLLSLEGDREAELHQRFADDRIAGGEWFNPSHVLNQFIAQEHSLICQAESLRADPGLELRSDYGHEHLLACPVCNDGDIHNTQSAIIAQHPGPVELHRHPDENDVIMRIPMRSECGHWWSLTIRSHGGFTWLDAGPAEKRDFNRP